MQAFQRMKKIIKIIGNTSGIALLFASMFVLPLGLRGLVCLSGITILSVCE